MTFSCQAASKSTDYMLLTPLQRSKSEDMKLIVIKNELKTKLKMEQKIFFLKNLPISIRRVGSKIKSKMSLFMVGE